MHEVRIGSVPYLTEDQERITDMHSFFNVLNIIIGELSLVASSAPSSRALIEPYQLKLDQIGVALRHSEFAHRHVLDLDLQCEPILEMLGDVESNVACPERRQELASSRENLLSVFKILKQRVMEFASHDRAMDHWQWIPLNIFRAALVEVFRAIERNARGRYKICFTLKDCRPCDYLIDLVIESDDARGLYLPLRMQDIVRDLAANSRKYTEPGGAIRLNLAQVDGEFRCTVEDSGIGIPAEEISKVVEFGYRASNVRDRRSFGGGFGLTKAACLVHRWGGQTLIASELGRGTRICVAVPLPV